MLERELARDQCAAFDARDEAAVREQRHPALICKALLEAVAMEALTSAKGSIIPWCDGKAPR